ncbi:MAG: bifunctional UDP-N-acetylmuramoyl-tripeptide:D-alanyl-D-alanine ligase/alanine racemase [Bacteroidales bacterium]|nr:bifunctional UDP-N-acetylmuramoyl-tripeptide:D-alanyl-D-alanine ligase/alanine racemase [Bacteroidales bacterium]
MTINEIRTLINPSKCQIVSPHAQIGELCFDSRQIKKPTETLFFAFKTDRNDGHRYIPDLLDKGVRHFVVTTLPDRWPELDDNQRKMLLASDLFVVKETLTALQSIAAAHRRRFQCPTIGITGSNGKTIVKEWLSDMLAEDRHVTASPDSYNSQIGVPLSIWQLNSQTEVAVFEAGISKPDEMERLADIIRPTIGILTNIGMAHARFFRDNRQKTIEKLKLFSAADTLVYHDDNEEVNILLELPEYQHLKMASWGSTQAKYPVTERYNDGKHACITLAGHRYSIPFLDAASIENATHAIVTMLELGYRPDVIDQRLQKLSRVTMRTEILEGNRHSVIINDTYSLDINSLRAALDFLDTQNQMPQKAIILSDFEQVGELKKEEYREINDLLHAHNITTLVSVGHNFCEHRSCFDIPTTLCFPDTSSLLLQLADMDFSYQSILVKGARVFHFEQIVNQLQHKTHLTILNVSLPALVHNLEYHRALLKPDTKIVAMVKAHSYGLGDVELINELVYRKIDYLAVAYTDEGLRLRKRHIQTPIIVLGAEAHSFDVMVEQNLEPEVFNFYYLSELAQVLKRRPKIQQFHIHIKLDTGMHRLGFDEQDLDKLIQIVKDNPQLKIASVFSHLAAAEDPNEDAYTLHQIHLFERMAEKICNAFDYPILRHILNSAGIARFPQYQFDMVRLGISLYGFSGIPAVQPHLQNVATLKTVITQVKRIAAGETIGYNRSHTLARDSQVAIIPIGYADGYPRELANGKGTVLIQGQKVPVIGKICMDMCMLDVTGLSVHEGDEVIVYGEGNSAADMADAAGLISYELLTRLSQRVPRVYVKE